MTETTQVQSAKYLGLTITDDLDWGQHISEITCKATKTLGFLRRNLALEWKRGSRVVSALASCARGPGFDPRRRRGKFVGPNTLPFVSFAGMT